MRKKTLKQKLGQWARHLANRFDPVDPLDKHVSDNTPRRNSHARIKLTINLSAIRNNYRILKNLMPDTETGATLKANAYGLGIRPIADALWREGCRNFFVSTIQEGTELRRFIRIHEAAFQDTANIYVLQSIRDTQDKIDIDMRGIICSRLIPVLSYEWSYVNDYCAHVLPRLKSHFPTPKLPVAFEFNSGMNRSGVGEPTAQVMEFSGIGPNTAGMSHLDVQLVMSHFANATNPDHPQNAKQIEFFERYRKIFSNAKTSFANSAGMYLLKDRNLEYLSQLNRPGIALLGGNPTPGHPNPMQNAVTLTTDIFGMHENTGNTVGYDGSGETVHLGQNLMSAAIGYNDWSLLRDIDSKGYTEINGQKKPILITTEQNETGNYMPYIPPHGSRNRWISFIGKPCMDTSTIDGSNYGNPLLEDLYDEPVKGPYCFTGGGRENDLTLVLIGQKNPIDSIAQQFNTSPQAVLTALNTQRMDVHYINPESDNPDIALKGACELV